MGQNFLSAYSALFLISFYFIEFKERTYRKHFKKIVKNGEFLAKVGF